MEPINVKIERLHPIMINIDMQTRFLKNALEGISEIDMHNRLSSKANHAAWLAGSLVEQRFDLANAFTGSGGYKQEAHELFKDNQGIIETARYPTTDQYIEDWEMISPVLRQQLLDADQNALDKKIEMPGMTMSLYELLTFSLYREANHLGQIALWRRILGYPPMKYM